MPHVAKVPGDNREFWQPEDLKTMMASVPPREYSIIVVPNSIQGAANYIPQVNKYQLCSSDCSHYSSP